MTSTIQTRGWKGQHHDADVRVFAPRQVDRLAQDSDAIGVGVRVDAALSQVAVPVASTRCSVPSFIMTVGMHPSLGSILPFQIRECATTAVFRQDISRVLTREDGRHVAGRFGCTVLLKPTSAKTKQTRTHQGSAQHTKHCRPSLGAALTISKAATPVRWKGKEQGNAAHQNLVITIARRPSGGACAGSSVGCVEMPRRGAQRRRMGRLALLCSPSLLPTHD